MWWGTRCESAGLPESGRASLARAINDIVMVRPAKVTTTFPSVLETAKRIGVSKRDAMALSEMAERSQRTGVFVLPGVGRVGRADRKNSVRVSKLRRAKAADALVPPRKSR
jgi:hypothetical protein